MSYPYSRKIKIIIFVIKTLPTKLGYDQKAVFHIEQYLANNRASYFKVRFMPVPVQHFEAVWVTTCTFVG